MILRLKLSNGLLSGLCALVLACPVLANADLEMGMKLFKSGQFNTALSSFNELARQYPDRADVHYWQGKCLQALGRATEAGKEFKLAMALGLPKNLEASCKECMGNAEEQSQQEQANAATPEKKPVNLDPPQIKSSLDTIFKQTESRMKDSLNEGNRYSSASMRSRESVFRPWPGVRSAFPPRGRSGYSSRDPYREAAQQRAVALNDAASGLESQMTIKPHKWSGVYLDPSNTNLYVRNYAHFTPETPEPLVPLQADPAVLSDAAAAAAKLEAAKATAQTKHHSKHSKHSRKEKDTEH